MQYNSLCCLQGAILVPSASIHTYPVLENTQERTKTDSARIFHFCLRISHYVCTFTHTCSLLSLYYYPFPSLLSPFHPSLISPSPPLLLPGSLLPIHPLSSHPPLAGSFPRCGLCANITTRSSVSEELTPAAAALTSTSQQPSSPSRPSLRRSASSETVHCISLRPHVTVWVGLSP